MPAAFSSYSVVGDRIRQWFGGVPCHVQAAALPWRRGADGIEILLLTSRGTGRWVLPKGWPEGEERPIETAEREALEEAGVSGTLVPAEIGRFIYAKSTGSGLQKRCEVQVFAMQVEAEHEDWPERAVRERRWFSPEEAAEQVVERGLSEILLKFRG